MTNSTSYARRALAVAAIVLLSATAVGVAMAAGRSAPALRTASNAMLHQTIVVDARGSTVYVLSPETTHHLLCTSPQCLHVWPPVTVRSARGLYAASGVRGRLGMLRRAGGTLQLTLDGRPLYRFAADKAGGDARGEWIRSFGGTWLVVPAAASPAAPAPPTAPTTSYGY